MRMIATKTRGDSAMCNASKGELAGRWKKLTCALKEVGRSQIPGVWPLNFGCFS